MITRRFLIQTGLVGVAAAPSVIASAASSAAKRSLRIAHLTDIHVQPELESAKGLASCFTHVQSSPERGEPAPDLIITGGETIMDCMDTSRGSAEREFRSGWMACRAARQHLSPRGELHRPPRRRTLALARAGPDGGPTSTPVLIGVIHPSWCRSG
jgi:glycerate-2-kinase